MQHLVETEDQIAEQMEKLLRGFLKQNPDFNGRDFYVSGESYAGKYVPAVTHRLLFTADDIDLELKGLSIGNGYVDPFTQAPVQAQFAHDSGLIDDEELAFFKDRADECKEAMLMAQVSKEDINSESILEGINACNDLDYDIRDGRWNAYDFRLPCEYGVLCYDFS